MKKVFIDGSEGTTGLRILERFEQRNDVELLKIDPEKRKDPVERKALINESDITFLCLPDQASVEAVSLVDENNKNTVIIDASTAHRTEEGWAYGLPELGPAFRDRIRTGKRIAVPGCYASGFQMCVYPLISAGIIDKDYPVSVTAVSGYSGAGKKAIALYESPDRTPDLSAPREYALKQTHKHLKEMQKITGLTNAPLFTPWVCDYYSGMIVSFPIYTHLLKKKVSPEELRDVIAGFFEGEKFIHVEEFGAEEAFGGFLNGNMMSGRDDVKIFVTGSDDRMLVSAVFDNLGKGASGAAIQCMNIVLGEDEAKGLNIE